MVYLLKMVIFYGELLNNQMVIVFKFIYTYLILACPEVVYTPKFLPLSLTATSKIINYGFVRNRAIPNWLHVFFVEKGS